MRRFLSTCFFLLLVNPALAQEREGFFERDFAKSPLEKESGGAGELKGDVMPSAQRSPVPTSVAVEGNLFDPESVPTVAPATPTVGPIGTRTVDKSGDAPWQGPTLASYRVGAILSGMKESHLRSALEELIDFSEKSKLPIGKVYVLGRPGEAYGVLGKIMNDGWKGVRYFRIGGAMQAVTELPSQYAEVKTSPTWIVETDKGQVLLEGIQPLAAQFTKDNFLKDR